MHMSLLIDLNPEHILKPIDLKRYHRDTREGDRKKVFGGFFRPCPIRSFKVADRMVLSKQVRPLRQTVIFARWSISIFMCSGMLCWLPLGGSGDQGPEGVASLLVVGPDGKIARARGYCQAEGLYSFR